MTRTTRLINELRNQGLYVGRRYVASINDGDFEHAQTDSEDACGLFIRDATTNKTATAMWQTRGPLHELFVIAENRLLEQKIVDIFQHAFDQD